MNNNKGDIYYIKSKYQLTIGNKISALHFHGNEYRTIIDAVAANSNSNEYLYKAVKYINEDNVLMYKIIGTIVNV